MESNEMEKEVEKQSGNKVLRTPPVVPEVDKRFVGFIESSQRRANPFESLHRQVSTQAWQTLIQQNPNPVSRLNIELPKVAQKVVELQKPVKQSTLELMLIRQAESAAKFLEPVRVALQRAEEFLSQPHIVDVVRNVQVYLKELNVLIEEDEKIKKHNGNHHFWENVNRVSKELILFPQGLSHEVLDYMDLASCNVEEVKRMIGQFDALELEAELEDEEHNDYLFKPYLQEILELHKTNPGNYRVSIPALFAILEGTLGQIFKISEGGMAFEIKRKMKVFWDIYRYVYDNQRIGSSFAFWNRLLLANTKGVFEQLTVNSKNAVGILNRNAVLHGKSNPNDWTLDDFEMLLSLLHTTLFLRKAADILTMEFHEMIHDEFDVKQMLVLDEFEKSLPIKEENGKPRPYEPEEITAQRMKLQTDLSHIFKYDKAQVEFILSKSNFHEIEERLLAKQE